MVRKAIEPIGESRADWEIICELAKRMRNTEEWDYAHPSEIMEEIASLTPIYGGVSYERIEREGFLQWPCRDLEDPGTPFLHKERFARGKGRFHAIKFKEAEELPDDEYPFILTTGRTIFHWHTGTMTRRSEKLEKEVPENYVEINPQDARKLGLRRMEKVRIISRRGEIEARAFITNRVAPGVVFIPFHFAESAANLLTISALDPVAKIPEYKVCAVKVERR
jgi:predicted molibdopterin-dependent oxidoreductase YjgC